MNILMIFVKNRATVDEVALHLRQCALAFVPPLGSRVDITVYAEKLVRQAVRFEAWSSNDLVGLVATYFNNKSELIAFVSSVSVLPSHQGLGIASSLLAQCLECAKTGGFRYLELEVDGSNLNAINLYLKMGFLRPKSIGGGMRMQHFL